MNVHEALVGYVNKILSVSGMKALLLDDETSTIVAMVTSQSEIIQKQVFLVERLDLAAQKAAEEKKENMHHLKAVCFIRPSSSSVKHLQNLIKSAQFKEYYIFFSNITSSNLLSMVAEADQHELVRSVEEYFGDYYVLDDSLFHCNLPMTVGRGGPTFDRNVTSVLSVLLSLKKRPLIRYEGNSDMAKELALEITKRMKNEADLFHTQNEATLLILDRREDPVTPLLQQWTYQAMVHELLGITNNRVDMSTVPGIKNELREVVLNPHQDHFYKGSMFLNFGELGASVKDLVQNYQRKTKDNSNLDSIEDMQKFVDSYPEFRQLAGNVSKHVTVMTELSRLVEQRSLMKVSELEQELACGTDHGTCLQSLLEVVNSQAIRFDEKLRLVMLYALRYESRKSELINLKGALRDRARVEEMNKIRVIDSVLLYGGADMRGGDLFGNKSLGAKASKFFTSALKGVDNIYTQHRPLLVSTLDQLIKGKLKPTNYPFMDVSSNTAKQPVQDVIVFIVGGVTYEERCAVNTLLKEHTDSGCRVLLGGSCVLNTKTFLDGLLTSH